MPKLLVLADRSAATERGVLRAAWRWLLGRSEQLHFSVAPLLLLLLPRCASAVNGGGCELSLEEVVVLVVVLHHLFCSMFVALWCVGAWVRRVSGRDRLCWLVVVGERVVRWQ